MADQPENRGNRSSEHAVYVISVVADLAGVHPQTLRMYERRGLLEPKRTAGNSRRYSEDDVDQLKRIQELTQEGINLAGVAVILDLERRLKKTHDSLLRSQSLVSRMRDRIEILEDRLNDAEEVLRSMGRSGVLVRMSDVRNIFESKEQR
jgi:MerR family transcriptional regulator/heat shock protein HspR